jgi:hypothetical protein
MELQSIKTGDVLLVTSYNSFISKAIVHVMKRWAKKLGLKPDFILSHAGTFVWINGILYVYGSIDSGYKPWIFEDHYDLNSPNQGIVIQRRNIPLTKEEEDKTVKYVQHLTTVSLMYQYWNFIQWLILVYLGWNLFRKDRDAFTYCFEAEYKRRKDLNPEWYPGQDYRVDFFMLSMDKHYPIIFKHLKA